MSIYKIEDIKVGDKVFFRNNYIENFDLYWTVIGKNGNTLLLKINEMGCNSECSVKIGDITIKE